MKPIIWFYNFFLIELLINFFRICNLLFIDLLMAVIIILRFIIITLLFISLRLCFWQVKYLHFWWVHFLKELLLHLLCLRLCCYLGFLQWWDCAILRSRRSCLWWTFFGNGLIANLFWVPLHTWLSLRRRNIYLYFLFLLCYWRRFWIRFRSRRFFDGLLMKKNEYFIRLKSGYNFLWWDIVIIYIFYLMFYCLRFRVF